MRVSLNEIQVMCRKAFEGMGFAPATARMPPSWWAGCNCKGWMAWVP